MLAIISLEAVGRAPEDLLTAHRRADILLHMINDQVRPTKVADERFHLRIVHGVGQVADQGHVLSVVGHLSQTERPSQHTHIGVNPNEEHVLDSLQLQNAPVLSPVVGDEIFPPVNLQRFRLSHPRGTRVPSPIFQLFRPFRMFFWVIILATI